MLILLENAECLAPEYLGLKDILIVKDIIYKICEPGSLKHNYIYSKIIDCTGLLVFPGIIDGHVHITGGGGENGPSSRIGGISAEEIALSGVTAVVGLLGADCRTKSLRELLAKARALEAAGITSYIYSGSYEMPAVTFTGDMTDDLLLIDKVVGAGEIAVSDYRSSHPDIKSMLSLASKVFMGGLLSGKAGLLHLHLGDGKSRLKMLNALIKESDLPKEIFLPTHINRNRALFKEGVKYCLEGGNIDLTAGEKIGLTVYDAVRELISKGADMDRVTISSDGNAGTPEGGICKIGALYEDIKICIKKQMNPSQIISLVTKNVSKRLKLYPKKGIISENSDADLVVTDKDYNIKMVFCGGKLLVNNGNFI